MTPLPSAAPLLSLVVVVAKILATVVAMVALVLGAAAISFCLGVVVIFGAAYISELAVDTVVDDYECSDYTPLEPRGR